MRRWVIALVAVSAAGAAIVHTPSGAQDRQIGSASGGCLDVNNCGLDGGSGTYLDDLSSSFLWNGGDVIGQSGPSVGPGGLPGRALPRRKCTAMSRGVPRAT
jgi:hypothetical protein